MSQQQKHEYLDVVALMVKNYREEKPLLEGAVLFRGSRFGEQTPSSDTPNQMHAHLLPQVAAGYTHSWGKGESIIDTYPLDRDNTRFFASQSLDEHLKGNQVRSYSVQDAERAIRPLVENLAYLPQGSAWDRNAKDLESFIKSSFYEAGVPVQTLEGGQTQPKDRFFYSGKPNLESVKEVLLHMEAITPENEARAKALYAMARPTDAAKAIKRLEAFHPEASRAFKVLEKAVQRDQAESVLSKFGGKPLMEFIAHAQKEPSSEAQGRVLRLAQGLAASLDSFDPNVRARAQAVTKQIGGLDPGSATMQDVGEAISRVSTASRSNDQSPARETATATHPQRSTASTELGMSR